MNSPNFSPRPPTHAPFTLLLPLHGGRGLGRDVVHHPVHVLHLVTDLRAHLLQKLGLELVPVRGHPVDRLDDEGPFGRAIETSHVPIVINSVASIHSTPTGSCHTSSPLEVAAEGRARDLH